MSPPVSPASPTEDGGGGGGNARTAQKLLKPKRRRQIEVWLDEAVRWEQLQGCAVGLPFGHSPAAGGLDPLVSSSSPQPSPPSHQEPATPSSHPPPAAPKCQVCGRHFTREGGQDMAPPPTGAATSGGPPGRARQMFWGVMNAMGSLRIKEGDKAGDGEWDPALSTRMFLVEATDGGGSSSSDASGLDSSDGGGGGKKQVLDERMARLRRAQKLLEKSQPKPR